jgi:quinol monooxygenase YgiN
MAFIQIIEARTSNVDALRAIDEEWEQATRGERTARRSILTRDRQDPNRCLIVVFFDSYDSAMENSNLPETQRFAQKWAAAVDGPLAFHDLDVIEDRSD